MNEYWKKLKELKENQRKFQQSTGEKNWKGRGC